MTTSSDEAGGIREEVLGVLTQLHRCKDAAYQDAWRRRGEMIANLARKYDRLVIAFAEDRPAATESLPDTVGDLGVYAAKYVTRIAETHPDGFGPEPLLDVTKAAACSWPSAVDLVFGVLPRWEMAHPPRPGHTASAWKEVRAASSALEVGLLAQSDATPGHDHLLGWDEKTQLAWRVASASSWVLAYLTADGPRALGGLRAEVRAMLEAER